MSKSSSSSALNPYAPLFVPLAYQTVEDFSDEWWALVQSRPWFRQYWLQERFQDPQEDLLCPDADDDLVLPADLGSLFDEQPAEEERGYCKDLVTMGVWKWRKGRASSGLPLPRCFDKAPRIVNGKVSPRTIHQPR